MKVLECFISLTLLSVVNSLPVKMICVPVCNEEITASSKFVNEWRNNSTGLLQLLKHGNTVTVVAKLLIDGSTDRDNKFEETYIKLVNLDVPTHTNVSIDTIRRYFNVYLSHKYVIDYLAELGADKLVAKHWASYSKATNVHKQLAKLQDVLNYNVINIAHLLNTTCDACTKNCSKSTTFKATLIDALENTHSPPIHDVVYTIAKHSRKLYRHLESVIDKSQNNNNQIMETTANTDVNDLCLCNTSS